MAKLKVRLLAEGLRVELGPDLTDKMKPILRVRSGSCGGLDLVLPDGTWVNCPVRERFAEFSPFRLVEEQGAAVLVDGDARIEVELVPVPRYYGRVTSTGTAMRRIGALCSDRVGVGITNDCVYWRSTDRCKFCSIGLNIRDEDKRKGPQDVLETVLAAIDDPVAPAHHILIGGGTPDGDDAGTLQISEWTALIKRHSDISIYAMLVPPRDLTYFELLAEAGVDEVGLNVEVFTERAAREYVPAKHQAISFDNYWKALERCVELFGPVNTRSITVVGLDPASETVKGVSRLASMGVLPILSPLRPLGGTALQDRPPSDANDLWELTLQANEAAAAHDMPLGPTCIACQSNTLTIPGDRRYRLY